MSDQRITNKTDIDRGIHFAAFDKDGNRKPGRVVVPAGGFVDVDEATAKIIKREHGFRNSEKNGVLKMGDIPAEKAPKPKVKKKTKKSKPKEGDGFDGFDVE